MTWKTATSGCPVQEVPQDPLPAGREPSESRPSPRPRRNFLACARSLLIGLLGLSFLQHSCVTSYVVSGNSMMPAYNDGDRVVVARLPPFLDNPGRGDTVIAKVHGEVLIKRVVGLPGEVIRIGDGCIMENDHLIEDPTPESYRDHVNMSPIALGQNEYFLMGDHRRVSIDSRDFGPVDRDHIIGQVVLHLPRRGSRELKSTHAGSR